MRKDHSYRGRGRASAIQACRGSDKAYFDAGGGSSACGVLRERCLTQIDQSLVVLLLVLCQLLHHLVHYFLIVSQRKYVDILRLGLCHFFGLPPADAVGLKGVVPGLNVYGRLKISLPVDLLVLIHFEPACFQRVLVLLLVFGFDLVPKDFH